MFSVLSSLPPAFAGLAALMIGALGLLGWRMHLMLHGPRARLRRRLAMVTGSAGDSVDHRRRGPKRTSVQDRLKAAEGSRNQERGYLMREQLRLAGFSISLGRYLAGCGFVALLLLAAGELAGLGLPISGLGAAILGLGLPKYVVGALAKRRVGRFGGQFPDAIDIIVRGIRSGLPLAECIGIISSEMPDPIGAEFRSIVEAQKLGMSLQSAVARAVIRMPIADLRYFSIVIAIQQQTGGNLAETLAKLSDVLRGRKRMRDKIAAYASEARASAIIIGSLPIVVILALAALAPHYIGLLFSTDLGNVLLAVGAITEVSGIWVMRKMINFDI
jgi:tight adherence protein B